MKKGWREQGWGRRVNIINYNVISVTKFHKKPMSLFDKFGKWSNIDDIYTNHRLDESFSKQKIGFILNTIHSFFL